MSRSLPTTWPIRCGDDTHSDATAGCGEETCTTVAIRLRPLNGREKERKQKKIWRCAPAHDTITQTTPGGNPLPDSKGKTFFRFDRIFDEDSTTQEVYESVAQEIVHSVVRGLNGTIFAYGQPSSGKTFTMKGGEGHDAPGIMQMAARDLFDLIEHTPDRMFIVRASYIEISEESVNDLLKPNSSNLQVRQDPRKGVYVEAHEEVISDFDSILKILNMGEKKHHVRCTKATSRSSRSHTLFRLVVESQEHYVSGIHESPEDVDPAVLVATLNLVDLAGYKTVRHTGATGIRQKTGGKINQSLLTLNRVIQTLSQGGGAHVNYRDSKLTRILQPSLSGNAGMAVICCAATGQGCLQDTRSTLEFASHAKEIRTRPVVNKVLDDRAQLWRVSRELASLKRKQAEARNGSVAKTERSAKIGRLKSLIINLAPVNEACELHLGVSPRHRTNKLSGEMWCPGEGEVRLPLSSMDTNHSREPCIATQDSVGSREQQRWSGVVDTPTLAGRSVTRSPLSLPEPRDAATPSCLSYARVRAQHEVEDMQGNLPFLQTERNERAAAVEVETSRVRQREAEVVQRKEEVFLLKDKIDAASKAVAVAVAVAAETGTVAVKIGASNSGERANDVTAQLAEAIKAKEALEEKLTEFAKYTDMKEKEMMTMKERMAAMEESLRVAKNELATIRAAQEGGGARNDGLVEDLRTIVKELEAVIHDRGEDGHEVLSDLMAALAARQKETTEERLRANEVLTCTLGAKREMESALSSAYETELRLRFRLEEMTGDVVRLATGRPEIVENLKDKHEKINFLEDRLGCAEKNLRIAKGQTRKAENLAEEARWKARQTNGFLMLKNAKIVHLIAQDERTKNGLEEAQVKADGLASELEAARQAVEAGVSERAAAASKFEANAKKMRSALEHVETSVAAKEEEITSLRQQAAHERQEAKAKQTYLEAELKAARKALETMTEVPLK